MANMLTLAAYERARRALREACELHCANAQMEFVSGTLAKEKEVTARATSFSFWSKCGDSNSRPPVPETGALPTALHLEISKLKVENGKLKFNFASDHCVLIL